MTASAPSFPSKTGGATGVSLTKRSPTSPGRAASVHVRPPSRLTSRRGRWTGPASPSLPAHRVVGSVAPNTDPRPSAPPTRCHDAPPSWVANTTLPPPPRRPDSSRKPCWASAKASTGRQLPQSPAGIATDCQVKAAIRGPVDDDGTGGRFPGPVRHTGPSSQARGRRSRRGRHRGTNTLDRTSPDVASSATLPANGRSTEVSTSIGGQEEAAATRRPEAARAEDFRRRRSGSAWRASPTARGTAPRAPIGTAPLLVIGSVPPDRDDR